MDLVDNHDPDSSRKASLSATRRPEIDVKSGVKKLPVVKPEGIGDNPTAREARITRPELGGLKIKPKNCPLESSVVFEDQKSST